MFGSCARLMYKAVFASGLSRGVCSPDYHHTPQIICIIVVLKVLIVVLKVLKVLIPESFNFLMSNITSNETCISQDEPVCPFRLVNVSSKLRGLNSSDGTLKNNEFSFKTMKYFIIVDDFREINWSSNLNI